MQLVSREKVKTTSSFACQLQSTCEDLSRVDLDLPEGLLVGVGYAGTGQGQFASVLQQKE